MGWIFRRIKGRIVPMFMGLEKGHPPGNPLGKSKRIVVTAKKEVVASAQFGIPNQKKSVKLETVAINQEFRGHGLGKKMFEHAQKIFGRAGKKFIRSSEIISEAQIKIRGKSGKSAFIGYNLPAWSGKTTRKIDYNLARKIAEHPKFGSTVKGTTMIPKKFRKPKK